MIRVSYPVIAIAAIGTVTLAFLCLCGIGYVSATKTGAEYETQIAAARSKVTEHDENLHQVIVAATGLNTLTVGDARHAAMIAMRRPGPDGDKIVMRELQRGAHELPNYSPAASQEVTTALRRYIPVYLKSRNLEKRLTSEYATKLESGWESVWLRAAGYPKSPLAPTRAVSQAPIAAKTKANPAR